MADISGAIPAFVPAASSQEVVSTEGINRGDLDEQLAAWAFNVMLECTRDDETLEMAIGGAILDLRGLERVLEWACQKRDTEILSTGEQP